MAPLPPPPSLHVTSRNGQRCVWCAIRLAWERAPGPPESIQTGLTYATKKVRTATTIHPRKGAPVLRTVVLPPPFPCLELDFASLQRRAAAGKSESESVCKACCDDGGRRFLAEPRSAVAFGFPPCILGKGANMEKDAIPGTSANERNNFKEQLKSIGEHEMPGAFDSENRKELEEWKEKLVKAEKLKADMLLLKLAADEKKKTLQNELEKLKDLVSKKKRQEDHKRDLSIIKEQNTELRKVIGSLKSKLESVTAQCEELGRSVQLKKHIPEKKMKCTRLENVTTEDKYTNMSCFFKITPKIPFRVGQGEALITFEEESVAQEVIRRRSHTVSLENEDIILQALPVPLETGVTFELHVKIPQQKVQVSDIPDLNLPDEWMRDKLELYFYKTKLGGEVQNVTYDQRSCMALVTFTQPIAANDIVKYGAYPFHAGDWIFPITVSPIKQSHIEKFQIFSGISRKTVLLKGIQTKEEDDENVQDMIAIHFQKPSSGGGEVESVRYVRKGTKIAYFENDNTSDVI
uniref:N-myc-interactor isoform X1 n=2 Tax=Pogona vitticeps TaxID=103695 RepID=A0A6J0UZ26_9SAUR